MDCLDDGGTCGLGGFCSQCPSIKRCGMKGKATVEDLELWAKDEKNPLIAEGYLMAARTITALTDSIKEMPISHQEPKDYGWYNECNGCGENLDKNKHYADCPFILAGVVK